MSPGHGEGERLRYRNGRHGYGAVTKALHWSTVAAILAQFVIGYRMDVDDAGDRREAAVEAATERLEAEAEGQGEAAEQRAEAEIDRLEDSLDAQRDDEVSGAFTDVVSGAAFEDGLSLLDAHVVLGLLVMALGIARIGWRRTTPLPPWAEHLGAGERRLEGGLEKVLLASLLVVPATGLLLVGTGDDWLPVHVTAQVVFLTAVAAHVGLVLRHTVLRRNRHLSRML